jgi:hypothetical protein
MFSLLDCDIKKLKNMQKKIEKTKNENDKNTVLTVSYPRDVYFNGSKVGLQEANGDIIFNDFKIGMQMTEMIQTKTYGVTDRDGKGNITSFATIVPLGILEDVKSEKRKLELNKRKGQIF